ncbi:MAG TPA: hypothetical protein VGH80_10955 [Xanthomonadaceae bacterium]|jgi:hypothetical protein
MLIFADESGTFAQARDPGSWCVVCGYAVAEHQRAPSLEALRRYKLRAGRASGEEVKRAEVAEAVYFRFLEDLAEIGGIAVPVATDAGLYDDVLNDQREQVRLIRQRIGDGATETDRVATELASAIERLSLQLFVEINCRIHMAWRTIRLGTLYFVRMRPASLSAFRWRMDRKDIAPTLAERAYRPLWAGVAAAISRDDPLNMWDNADYRHMEKFRKPPELAPTVEGRWYDASSLCLDELEFVDSMDPGVQIADLVASGVGACLRNRLRDNERGSLLLGRLMRRERAKDQAVQVIKFGFREHIQSTPEATEAIHRMSAVAPVLT